MSKETYYRVSKETCGALEGLEDTQLPFFVNCVFVYALCVLIACLFVCMYVCMYVYIYTYIHAYMSCARHRATHDIPLFVS